jgi:hypothetical protein
MVLKLMIFDRNAELEAVPPGVNGICSGDIHIF